jgi:hypothetical protein
MFSYQIDNGCTWKRWLYDNGIDLLSGQFCEGGLRTCCLFNHFVSTGHEGDRHLDTKSLERSLNLLLTQTLRAAGLEGRTDWHLLRYDLS